MKQYRFNNEIYTVDNCTINEIPSHIEKVLSYWADTDIEEHKDYMKIAVKDHTAIKITDSNNNLCACAYYFKVGTSTARMILLWFNRKPIAAILADYARLNLHLIFLEFNPHTTIDDIPFKFGLNEDTIRSHNIANTPLKCNLYGKKMKKVHETNFLNKGIERI